MTESATKKALGFLCVLLLCTPLLAHFVMMTRSVQLSSAQGVTPPDRAALISSYLPFALVVMHIATFAYLGAILLLQARPHLLNLGSIGFMVFGVFTLLAVLVFFPLGTIVGIFGVITFLKLRRTSSLTSSSRASPSPPPPSPVPPPPR